MAGIVAILLGAALVFFLFPKQEEEERLLAPVPRRGHRRAGAGARRDRRRAPAARDRLSPLLFVALALVLFLVLPEPWDVIGGLVSLACGVVEITYVSAGCAGSRSRRESST